MNRSATAYSSLLSISVIAKPNAACIGEGYKIFYFSCGILVSILLLLRGLFPGSKILFVSLSSNGFVVIKFINLRRYSGEKDLKEME